MMEVYVVTECILGAEYTLGVVRDSEGFEALVRERHPLRKRVKVQTDGDWLTCDIGLSLYLAQKFHLK